MGRRTRAWHTVQASKAEALLAVEFYNTTGERRSIEAFVVHMHLAWLYLLHAEFLRDHVDYRYWETGADGRRRLARVDGEPKTWELGRCVRERRRNENDPIRRNLEFFIGLRNRIEHRHQESIGLAVAGHAQAMILNYEAELVAEFGADESLAQHLRFPVFVSSITPDGIAATKRLRARMPARTSRYINDFHEGLDDAVAADTRFEFRVNLVPQVGPKTGADLAINFVSAAALDPASLTALESQGRAGLVAKLTKKEPVQNLGKYRPHTVVERVAEVVEGFNMADHTAAWKRYGVRPASGADDPTTTDARYAVFDEPHGDYLYTDAWVRKLVRDNSSTGEPTGEGSSGDYPSASASR